MHHARMLWALNAATGQPIFAGAARPGVHYVCPATGATVRVLEVQDGRDERYVCQDGTEVAPPAYARAVTAHLIADRIRWWVRGSTGPRLLRTCQSCDRVDEVPLPDGVFSDARLDVDLGDGVVADVGLLDDQGTLRAVILLHDTDDEALPDTAKLEGTGLPWLVLPVSSEADSKEGACFWRVIRSRRIHQCASCSQRN